MVYAVERRRQDLEDLESVVYRALVRALGDAFGGKAKDEGKDTGSATYVGHDPFKGEKKTEHQRARSGTRVGTGASGSRSRTQGGNQRRR